MSTLMAKNGKIIGGLPVPVENLRLLWYNPSPNAAFEAQRITLLSDDYDFLLLIFNPSVSSNYYLRKSVIAPKGSHIFTDTATMSSGENMSVNRGISYENYTTYYVDDAYYALGATFTKDNASNVPISIYGIKKDSVGGSGQGQVKTTVVTGTTDATGNLVLASMHKNDYTILSASGTMEGEGELNYLIGGIPMIQGGGYWFLHVIGHDNTVVASRNISLRISYIEN